MQYDLTIIGIALAIICIISPILINTNKIKRDVIREKLAKNGIQTSIHYHPIHLFRIYSERFGYQEGDLPLTEWVSSKEITLPLYPGMEEEDITYVIKSLKDSIAVPKRSYGR